MQEDSRKRQRVVEEKDTPRPPRLGCTCGTNREGSHHKCGARCPCQKDGKPCNDNCRCTVDNCQNTAGIPPARPERRGRPQMRIPVSAYMEPTQRLPSPEDSYQDDESEYYNYQARTQQTARKSPRNALFGKEYSSDITGDGPDGPQKKIQENENIRRNTKNNKNIVENKNNKNPKKKPEVIFLSFFFFLTLTHRCFIVKPAKRQGGTSRASA